MWLKKMINVSETRDKLQKMSDKFDHTLTFNQLETVSQDLLKLAAEVHEILYANMHICIRQLASETKNESILS